MRPEFIEMIEGLVVPADKLSAAQPTVLVITKAGKFLRGHISDHNVRLNSDGRVRGRIVLTMDGANREIDANDITSLEKIASK
jgi:hypothetical protein